jgi:sporulation protein YlmC with PRC-barrel domain
MRLGLLTTAAITIGAAAYVPATAATNPPALIDTGGSESGAQIPVMPADKLVGRALVDPQGHDAGQIVSLLLDTSNGSIEYVLIGSRGNFNLNGRLAVVHWSVLHEPIGDGPITIGVPAQKLANGPLVTENALSVLDQAPFRKQIAGNYAYPYRRGYPNAYYGYRGAFAAPVVVTQGQPSEKPVASALRSPDSASPRGLRGISVNARNGDVIGDIDQVMIDPSRGQVAFVLVKRGGFLGLDPAWFAMPIEALNWSPDNDQYRLTVDEAQLKNVPPVPANAANLTGAVDRQALSRLYADFNLQPYWNANTGKQTDNHQG